ERFAELRPFRYGAIRESYRDTATLPSTAIPSAAPSSRVASFIAEPAPARRAGTAAMIDAVIGDLVSAIPPVSGTKQTTMNEYGLWTPSTASRQNESEMLNIPNATVRCAPKRALSRGVRGATTIMIT